MKVEKIFKRYDGSKIKLIVEFFTTNYSSDPAKYKVEVYKCAPNKRTYYNVIDSDDYRWRDLSMVERSIANMNKSFEYITRQELQKACNECLELCRPSVNNIFF